jgi:ribose-phosphate pyrophosphokinase
MIIVNKKRVDAFNFPGGECHLKIITDCITDDTHIYAYLDGSDEIMRLLLSVDAIRRVNPLTRITLTIPYFPYARQDRVCNRGEPLSVKVMAELINSLGCDLVEIFDPHSDVTPALIKNCVITCLTRIIVRSELINMLREKKISLLSPDAGAEKKVSQLAKYLSGYDRSTDVVLASKVRDTRTGQITSTTVHGDFDGKDIMIVDDICDGGRTFVELAKVLVSGGAGRLYLYVTHGIFSKGLDELKLYFSNIYCCHTMLDLSKQDPDLLTILNITGA